MTIHSESRFPAYVAAVLAPLAFAASAGAQDADEEGQDSVMEEILVTGIRQSVVRSLDIKRDSAGFVDAISSEDVGKLPDQNVAEALQRIPGITITRSRGEGNFVNIRGLGSNFTRATLNGRTIASGEDDRTFNFDVLAAESIGALEVYKTPFAGLEEGGVGGTINVRTARPLDVGSTYAASARGTDDSLHGTTSPRVSGLASWVDESDSVGFLLSAAYSERDLREDATGTLFFLGDSVVGMSPFYDTDADGVGDSNERLYFPLANNESLVTEGRERFSLNGALQWRPDADTELNIDFLHTQFDIDTRRFTQTVVFTPLAIFGPATDVVNADGSLRATVEETAPGNSSVVTGTSFNNANVTSIGVGSVSDTETAALGANFSTSLEDWTVSVDASWSRATRDFVFRQGVVEATMTSAIDPDDRQTVTDARVFPASFAFGGQRTALFQTGLDLSDPGLYQTRNHRIDIEPNRDEEVATKLDAQRELNWGMVSALSVGASLRTREKSVERSRFESSAADRFALVDGVFTQFPVDNFTGNDRSGVAEFLYPNIDRSFDYVFGQLPGDEVPKVNAPNTFSISEEVLAAYLQFELDGDFLGRPLVGNFGVRVVNTNSTSNGTAPGSIELTDQGGGVLGFEVSDLAPTEVQSEYTEALPSFSLRYELSEDLFLRLAAARQLNRPQFADLSPRLNVEPTQRSATAGNPLLGPYLSEQVDVGLEWYFDEASAITGAFFRKDIGGFIQGFTRTDVEYLGTRFNSLTQPFNAGAAEIVGFEAGVQHAFISLPAPFDGLGVIANYTVNDSEITIADSKNAADSITTSFPQTSDNSYNLIAYYDSGALQARIAYAYRSDFVDQASAAFANEIVTLGYGQLDAFVSYNMTGDISVFFEGVNLTEEPLEQNVSQLVDTARPSGDQVVPVDQPYQTFVTGRRLGIGVRARF